MRSLAIGRILALLGLLWFGLMAGFFWSFSVVVMPGLEGTDPLAAMRSMQSINDGVRNALFAIGFFGAPLLGLALVIQAFTRLRTLPSALTLAAVAVYLLGVFLVTVAFNVPLNRELASVDPSLPANASVMRAYVDDWTTWNHVRTLAGILAFGLLAVRLLVERSDATIDGATT
jgi:uncharacterized membrane protein